MSRFIISAMAAAKLAGQSSSTGRSFRGFKWGLLVDAMNSMPYRSVPATWLQDFLSVSPDTDVGVAQQAAQEMSLTGVPILNSGLRNQLTLQVSNAALDAFEDVVAALQRSPDVETAVGLKATDMAANKLKSVAMGCVVRAIKVAIQTVSDGRLVVQTWQHEAQAAIAGALLEELSDPSVDHQQLVVDADEVLGMVEDIVVAARAKRQTNADAVAGVEAQVADQQKEILLLQTMRDIREGKPVDPTVQRNMAAYYVELTGADTGGISTGVTGGATGGAAGAIGGAAGATGGAAGATGGAATVTHSRKQSRG